MTTPIDLSLLPLAVRIRRERLARRVRAVLLALGALALWTSSTAAQADVGSGRGQSERVEACAELRAAAQDVPDPELYTLNGIAGMWFPMPSARLQLCELRELRLQRRRVRLTGDELALWGRQVEILREELALAIEAKETAEDALQRAINRADRAQARASHWSRSRALWVAVGVVGAVLVMAGSSALVDAVTE